MRVNIPEVDNISLSRLSTAIDRAWCCAAKRQFYQDMQQHNWDIDYAIERLLKKPLTDASQLPTFEGIIKMLKDNFGE